MNLLVHPFFESASRRWSYLLVHSATGRAAIIDPVMGYEAGRDAFDPAPADRILELVEINGYCVEWILETDLHAHHVSAARYLKSRLLCAQVAIGEHVVDLQAALARRLGLDIPADGRQFDRLLTDGERLRVGHTCGRVLHTPGHTPAGVSYPFDGFVFVGDTVLRPDHGTARCDVPGGNPTVLFRSIQKLYALPGATRMMLGHAPGGGHAETPCGRPPPCSITVADQRRENRMLRPETPLAEFVAVRRARDDRLSVPPFLPAALRANLQGGAMPGEIYGSVADDHSARDRAIA